MIAASHQVSQGGATGRSNSVAPEPGSGPSSVRIAPAAHAHVSGAHAHFSDIADRDATALEAEEDAVDPTKFHISHKAPSRTDFVNALRQDKTAKQQIKQVAARMPVESVNEYTTDVLRTPTMKILDTEDEIDNSSTPVIGVLTASPAVTKAPRGGGGGKEVVEEEEAHRPPTMLESAAEYLLEGTPRHMTVRLRSKIKLANSPQGRTWDIFQVAISIVACVMHILSTYKENNHNDDVYDEPQQSEAEVLLELILSAFFAVDLLLHLYVCDDRVWFWTQSDTVVDVLTLFPVVISLAGSSVSMDTSFLRALRMLRAMRILRAFRVTKNSLSAVDQKVATLVIIIVSIIFMSACLVQTLEKANGMQDFGVALYFVVVTISTVGYGDYSPASPEGRFVVCIMIIGFMVIVPVKISELADLLAMRSPWHVSYHSKIGYRNILVIGSVLEPSEVEALLEEFFHPDRMKVSKDVSLQSTEVCIMAPFDPSEAMVNLLFVPFWQGQVYFINGSALDDRDLKRAGARTAEACFILIGKQSSPPRSPTDTTSNQELMDYYDSQNVLYTLMVENFNHRIKTFVEIRGIEKRYPLVAADADVVLCIDRLRMTLLGGSAIFPGLCTFMSNLWQSSADLMMLEGSDPARRAAGGKTWKSEYARARGMEIYERHMPDLFIGLTFTQAAFVVQRAFSGTITLLGVEERLCSWDFGDDGDKLSAEEKRSRLDGTKGPPPEQEFRLLRSLVAPGDKYVFPNEAEVNAERAAGGLRFGGLEMETLQVHAYFLADDAEQADEFSEKGAFLHNILHSLHELTYLKHHMQFSGGSAAPGVPLPARPAAPAGEGAVTGAPPSPASVLPLAAGSTNGAPPPLSPKSPGGSSSEDLGRARIVDSVASVPGLARHFIILAPPSSLSSMNDCLLPLRGGAGYAGKAESVPCLRDPVVVLVNKLQPKDLPAPFLKAVAALSQVYIVLGDHNSVKDLKRAGIMVSKSIVIIEDNDGMGSAGNEIQTATITKFLSTEQCLSMAAAARSDKAAAAAGEKKRAASSPFPTGEAVDMDFDFHSSTSGANAQSYVVETNSKATMNIMNRSVLNRLAHEKIDREVRKATQELSMISAAEANSAAAGGKLSLKAMIAEKDIGGVGTAQALDKVALAMQVRVQQKKLRLEEAEKARKMEEAMAHLYNSDVGYTMTPFFAAGFCFSSAVFDNLLVLSYFARGVLRFTECMLGLDPGGKAPVAEELEQLRLDPGVSSGKLVQIPIPIDPAHLEEGGDHAKSTITFSQVFDLLLVNYEAVTIGVYRAPSLDSQLPYVGSPEADAVVNWTDRLFVVAPPHQIDRLLRTTDKFEAVQSDRLASAKEKSYFKTKTINALSNGGGNSGSAVAGAVVTGGAAAAAAGAETKLESATSVVEL